MSQWITIEAERVLYVDRGRNVILCDDHHKGPVTLVVKVSKQDGAKLNASFSAMSGASK